MTVRSLYVLTRLHAAYGMIEDEDIQDIYMELRTPIIRETHFKDFVSHIEDNK